MNVNDYQTQATATASYPEWAKVLYATLGLVGEAGELVSKYLNRMWPYGGLVPDGEEPYQEALLAMVAIGQQCEVLKKGIRGGTADLKGYMKLEIQQWTVANLKEFQAELPNEVSDCVWYLSALLTDLGVSLEMALKDNLSKLAARKAKGAIHSHQPDSLDHKEAQ